MTLIFTYNYFSAILSIVKKKHFRFTSIAAAFFILIGAMLTDGLAADSFRCRGKIVSLNDTIVEVMDKCGKPTYKSRLGDYWVYDFGPNRYTQVVKFIDGKVNRIKTSGKGGSRLEE